jgi:hypothetical protein
VIQPGERYYGVLLDENGRFVRRDFAVDAWSGPPSNCVAFWAGRIPTSDKPQKPSINDELLLDCFDHLANATEPDRIKLRYVITLLLMRRKKLLFDDTSLGTQGKACLMVRDARSGAKYEIPDPQLSDAEVESLQDEIFRLLGWE